MEPAENNFRQEANDRSEQRMSDQLVKTIIDTVDVGNMLHPAIEVIHAYDLKNRSNLLHTLDVYLQNDCNAQHCGRILFLHRNSLVYRIHRIQEIAGIDLSDPEERSYLRLSFLLWKALNN